MDDEQCAMSAVSNGTVDDARLHYALVLPSASHATTRAQAPSASVASLMTGDRRAAASRRKIRNLPVGNRALGPLGCVCTRGAICESSSNRRPQLVVLPSSLVV